MEARYEYINNTLSVPAKLIYEELKLITFNTYGSWCNRGKLVRTKAGKGKGNTAWVSFYDISEDWVRNAIKNVLGDPTKVISKNELEDLLVTDHQAIKFYASHRKPNGKPLSNEKQREKGNTVMVLNAIQTLLNKKASLVKKQKIGSLWTNISEAVNDLATKTNSDGDALYDFKLPGGWRKLKIKYELYVDYGYSIFIHGNEGSTNARTITTEIGDYLLALYCLPTGKLTIPEVLERYDAERALKPHWKSLTNQAVYQFLYEPENQRIWQLARNGKQAYDKKYKYTLDIDKSKWFPNCYWAIDGTKLDWIHYWEGSANKMGAKLKIDVMFDVYSEKIIGWSLGFTENHIEHFKAIKMAVNEAQCRPFFLTYDQQSGHKMDRMNTLYDGLVAQKKEHKGTHYPGAAKQHGNPAEGLFKRLQQQVINKFWFNDGQSITVKRDDNKMNTDFILKNKSSLKTVEDLHAAWETAVNIWNAKAHPLFKDTTKESRNEVYQHTMDMKEPLSLYDIMDKMWIEEKKRPITFKSNGLDLRLGSKKPLTYVVYDKNGDVDLEFRRKNVGKKFIVRYDPDFLDGYIQLCEKDAEGNIVHIANAEPKRKAQPVPALMEPGDKEQALKDRSIRDLEFLRDKAAYEELMERTGITPAKEMEHQDLLIKFKGNLNKVQRAKVEANENLNAASRL